MNTPRTLDQVLTEWFDINDRIKQLEDAKAALQTEMRAYGEGAHESAKGTVTVSPQRRFNADRAAEVVPIDLYQLCQETVVSSARAKAILPPAVYEACMVEVGQPRVTVKAAS